jgi:hypothetical protein
MPKQLALQDFLLGCLDTYFLGIERSVDLVFTFEQIGFIKHQLILVIAGVKLRKFSV